MNKGLWERVARQGRPPTDVFDSEEIYKAWDEIVDKTDGCLAGGATFAVSSFLILTVYIDMLLIREKCCRGQTLKGNKEIADTRGSITFNGPYS